MNLRWKITMALAVVSAVIATTVGLVTYRSTDQRLLTEVDRSIDQAGQLLVANSARLDRQRQVLDVYSIRRVNARGEVTGTTFEVDIAVDRDVVAPLVGQPGERARNTVTTADGERFRIHTAGLNVGAVQVARSLDETDAVLEDLRQRTLILVALAALGAALVGWWIAGRVAAPLRRLAASAEEVRSTGRLDIDLPDPDRSDHDEVGHLSRAFASMLDALDRSRADQARLVQDAGHELRTPLTSLRTNLAVMRRHQNMPDEMRAQIVDDLDGEVSELTDLVNELVTVASGDLVDQPSERLDLGVLARAVAERVGRRRSRSIEVAAVEEAFVEIPRAGLDRSISNLIDNACKFDTSGGTISVEVAVSDTNASLRVRDRGPGIPVDDLGKVFDRFHRTEATRSLPGSGLGLSIVHDVLTAHGGSVSAANREGEGAVIGFDLPLVD